MDSFCRSRSVWRGQRCCCCCCSWCLGWPKPALVHKYSWFDALDWQRLIYLLSTSSSVLISLATVNLILHMIYWFCRAHYHCDKFVGRALRSACAVQIIVAYPFHRRHHHRPNSHSVCRRCRRMQSDCFRCCCCCCCYCRCVCSEFDGPRLLSMYYCQCYCCYCSLNYFVKLMIDVGRMRGDRVEDVSRCAVASSAGDASIAHWTMHTFDDSAIQ